MSDSALVLLGLAVLTLGVLYTFGLGWAAILDGGILFLSGIGAHLNGRETVAATGSDVGDHAA